MHAHKLAWVKAKEDRGTLRAWCSKVARLSLRTCIKRMLCKHVLSLAHWRQGRNDTIDFYCYKCGEETHHMSLSDLPKGQEGKILAVMRFMRFGKWG